MEEGVGVPGLAWWDSGSPEPQVGWLARRKTKQRGRGAWAWGLGNLERPPFLLFLSLQLLWSPWSPLGQGGSCLPRRLGSLASYSAATASRKLLCKPWGMEVQSEE